MNKPPAFDAVLVSLRRDLPILRRAVEGLRKFAPGLDQVFVVTAAVNHPAFRRDLPQGTILIDEDTLLPTMTLSALRQMNLPFFPKGAGWYFQQFLKYAVAAYRSQNDYCLIWDADTVLLRPLSFFDDAGRVLFTKAAEFHRSYFQTYQNLFGHEANREFSFISQHIMVEKTILLEMLAAIDSRHPGPENWPWKIMKSLRGEGSNLFSEYETYGHYVKNLHPDRAAFRELQWSRGGGGVFSATPSRRQLNRLSKSREFAAFEQNQTALGVCKYYVKRLLGYAPSTSR